MKARAQFDLRHIDHVPIVDCAGEIDLSNVHELDAVLQRAAHEDAGLVIVSLTHATYLDSQGLRTIFTAGERLATARQRLALVAPVGGTVRRIMEIAGVEPSYPIFATVAEAIASRR